MYEESPASVAVSRGGENRRIAPDGAVRLWENMKVQDTRDPGAPFTKNFYFDDRIDFSMQVESYQQDHHTHEASDGDGTYTARFDHQNWAAEATYTVSDAGSVDPLQTSIDEFRDGIQVANNASNWSTLWPNLSHSDLVDRAEKLASDREDAYDISQAQVGCCGVVSITFISAYRQPRRFVETCRSIYETGGFPTQSNREMSSGPLRHSPVGDDLDDLEWLYCGTLRESGNVDEAITATNLEDGTNMEEIGHWFTEVLGYQDVTWYYASGGTEGMDEQAWIDHAEDAVENGGAAVLDIDKELVTREVLLDPAEHASSWFNESNHNVAMVEDVELRNDQGTVTESDDVIIFYVHDYDPLLDGGSKDMVAIEWEYVDDYFFGVMVGW